VGQVRARHPVDERRRLSMSEPSKEELLARIAELEKQSGAKKSGKLEFKVGGKGGVSVYGLGRFPVPPGEGTGKGTDCKHRANNCLLRGRNVFPGPE
jgi:hypothetical protein